MMKGLGPPESQYPVSPRARWVDAICDRFEVEWRDGRRPRIEDNLSAVNGDEDRPVRTELLRELLLLEIELAREGGETPSPALYNARFPDDDALIEDVFARAKHRAGDDEEPSGRTGTDPGDPSPGGTIGRYAVLSRLDEGGEALVYRVLHVELGKPFILKLSRRRIDRASALDNGLAAQGRLLAELNHPGLVKVVDLAIHEGRPFLVMEDVPGLHLGQYAAHRRLTPRQAAAMVAEVAETVAFLHRRGIVHQDIKPRNILVDDSGRPRLIDFGQAWRRHAWSEARAEATGGTPAYMAPEQAEGDGDRITPQTDVFGLGAVLYELLCGRPPYQAPTIAELDELARAGRVVPPRQLNRRIPRALETICLRAMAREPSARYAGADELARALRGYLHRPLIIAAAVALAATLLTLIALGIAT
jgi:eukaryotic-like serine/threonine-protein kinase